jgi:periplasmic protein TonB
MLKKSLAFSAVLHLAVVMIIVFSLENPAPLPKPTPVVVTMVTLPQQPQQPQKVTPSTPPPQQTVAPQKVSPPMPTVMPVATRSVVAQPTVVNTEVPSFVSQKPVETSVAKPMEMISPPAPPKPPQVDKLSIKNQYLGYLRQSIEAHKVYPKAAKLLKQMGTAEISFTVMADGRIANVKVKKSSSFELLDKAAADILTLLVKVRPIPQELDKESLEFSLPIQYQLN